MEPAAPVTPAHKASWLLIILCLTTILLGVMVLYLVWNNRQLETRVNQLAAQSAINLSE